MNVINTNFRYASLSTLLSFLFILFATFTTGVCMFCSTSVFAKVVDTPYGPVEGMDFGKYGQEEFAERSAEEYDGQEAGAGVVTDLVFSLTEENMNKKGVRTTFKQMFEHFCGPCHGETGNGEGKNFASVFELRPTDHTDADYMSTLDDAHLVRTFFFFMFSSVNENTRSVITPAPASWPSYSSADLSANSSSPYFPKSVPSTGPYGVSTTFAITYDVLQSINVPVTNVVRSSNFNNVFLFAYFAISFLA